VFSFFISGQGGWSAFNESNSTWRALGVSGSGLFIFPSTTLLMFASVPALVNVAVKLRGVARFIVYAVIMFTVAIPALIFGFRIVLIPYLLIGVWVWHQYAQRIMVGRLVMGALVGIILLTGYGYLRDVSEGKMGIFDYWANGFLMRTNGAEVLTQVIKKSDNGIPHGVGAHSALEALTILVPRNMVEWKPVPFSEVFSELYFADYFLVRSGPDAIPSGISPTVLGQLFHEFGAIGCLLFMGLFGYIAGIVDSLGRQSAMLNILLYGVTLRFFLLLPESPQGAMSGAVIDIFAVFLVLSALRLLGGFVASREQERVPRLHKESDVCQLTT
jgi:hypothetical protein